MLRWRRDPAGLTPGAHVDTITVTASGVSGSPHRIVDTLRVLPALVVRSEPTRPAGVMGAAYNDALSAEGAEFAFVARVTSDTFFVDRSFTLSVSAPQLARQSVLDHLLGASSLDAVSSASWICRRTGTPHGHWRRARLAHVRGRAVWREYVDEKVCLHPAARRRGGDRVFRSHGPAGAWHAYVLHERAGQDGTRAVVFGALATGALATFEVPDVRRAAEYTATVLEVSGADNALRSDLGAHRLTVVR